MIVADEHSVSRYLITIVVQLMLQTVRHVIAYFELFKTEISQILRTILFFQVNFFLQPPLFTAEEFRPTERKKDKHLPEHLRDQWNKDRAKKAKHKKARAQARLEAAADPLTIKKGGKKGRKAMLAAAKFDPTVEIPHRVFDLNAIEQQIRRFIYDVESSTVMSLPPMEKQSRKQVHELALAFNLKSQSKGGGKARYITLTKTSRSGIMINEQKIRRMKRSGMFMKPIEGGSKGKGKSTVPKHREGEEVGKVGVFPSVLARCGLKVYFRQRPRLAKRILDSKCWLRWDGQRVIG